MKKKIVAMAVQNDEEIIARSFSGFYDYVDVIYISTDPYSGWSGTRIIPDQTLEIIRSLDKDKKCKYIMMDFAKSPHPLKNDTEQRQYICNIIKHSESNSDWIIQIDADEVFINFQPVVKLIETLPIWKKSLKWRLIPIFKTLEDGNLLVVVDEFGRPILEDYTLANRVNTRLESVRNPVPTNRYIKKIINPVFDGINSKYFTPPLHFTFAKSDSRIKEKMKTWGHAQDFNTTSYYDLWSQSSITWRTLKDFHPLTPTKWPRLKPFSPIELNAFVEDSYKI